jgi:hypothetical protein
VLKHDNNIKNKIMWNEPDDKYSNPDIISEYNNHIIIADSKYYKNIDDDFLKEMYEYNTCQNDMYPVVVLVPSDKSEFFCRRKHNIHELIVIKISVKEVLEDSIYGLNNSLDLIHNILLENSERYI